MSGGAPITTSQMPLQKVNEVQFQMFKASDIKQHAVCCIEEAKSYEHGEPVRGGINDLRMGTTDFDKRCETCGAGHPECPGHFGYLELAEPMFNIGVFDIVLTALKCVCKKCGCILLDTADEVEMKRIAHLRGVPRLRMVAKMCRTTCMSKQNAAGEIIGCNAKQHRIGRYQGVYPGLQVKATLEDQDETWYGDTVYEILNRVSDQDAAVMGFDKDFCHPRDLMLTVLPVPPPQVRPAVAFGSAKSDDELTHQIMSITKRNMALLRDKRSDVRQNIAMSRAHLQEVVATYFNNASTYYKPTKVNDTKTLKSLTERLKGKYGRLRGNLMGKRVDFSARTVITGDPNIDVDEVGVPFSIAMTLTFPERVSAINKKRLTEYVRRTTYPSANYIRQPNNAVLKLGLVKDREKIHLNIGDVVERHIVNGDVVLFNRQPTLHRMSMMGHRVRVLNHNTFRLNLSCTTPYNADFDGDEMNLHVPQSLLTKAELIEMMMVPKNFVSPNKSAPCMGIVQDSLLGSYRLTDKDTFLDKYFVQSVALWLDLWELPIPAILKPRPLWTGKQIFSLALPEVNHPATPYEKPPFPHNDKQLMIQRGQLLHGAITKGIVGAAPGSLIHVIFNERGSDEVAKFINFVQRITAFFLYQFAFSVGVQDTVADADTLRQMNDVLVKTRERVENIGAAANNGSLENKPGMTLLQSFEVEVNSALNRCREEAAKKALSNVRRTNSFKVMIEAGSKGTDLNICQIAVFVGQQNVAGSRIPFGFRNRTLPHFMLDDYGETSRGMANRGYVEGLRPHEFYFHTMAGREGLIDTAVKTSDTGYLQRKLVKALEDVHAAYDGTVRSANQELIQLMYGEDGLDGARVEGNQQFPLPHLNNKELADMFKYEYDERGSFTDAVGGSYMDPNIKQMLMKDPSNVRTLQQEYNQLLEDRALSRRIIDMEEKSKLKMTLPVNVGRLIQNARVTMGKRSQVSNLSPITVVDSVRKLQEDLAQLFATHHKGPRGIFTNEISRQRVDMALTLFRIHLRQSLGSKRVLQEYKLSDKAFEYVLKEIRTKYQQSLITPGEIIGAIAAQSCGEPATQMTLNTFHNAGISSKNVTLGVPRLLELLNVSKQQRNSSLAISLIPKWQSHARATEAQHLIEYCSLSSITKNVQIIYDPVLDRTVVPEDEAFLGWEHELDSDDEEAAQEPPSPFIARLILDAEMLSDKRLNMMEVNKAIRQVDDSYIIAANMETLGDRVVRLRPKQYAGEESVPKLLKEIPDLLTRVHLRGVKGVHKTLLKDTTVFTEKEADGSLKSEKAYMIDTEGTALRSIFIGVMDDRSNQNIINFRKTSSNKVPEVAQVLGIEAARRKMLYELREAYLAYGLNINYRHYSVLVDTMCQRGYLMAVSRSGINRSQMSGPLMRCSFEETVTVLNAAAAFGERDPVRGVSANLVLGNQARIGTGLFDLMLNMGALKNAVPQEEAVAPGKRVTVYHSLASVQNLPSSELPGGHFVGPEATPMVNEASAFYRAGAMDAALGSSALYGGGVHEASMVQYSQAYGAGSVRLGGGPTIGGVGGGANSASYSGYSGGAHSALYSQYAPSSAGSMASESMASQASSFHLQSSMPFMSSVLPQQPGAPLEAPSAPVLGTGAAAVVTASGRQSHASAPYSASAYSASHDFAAMEEEEEGNE